MTLSSPFLKSFLPCQCLRTPDTVWGAIGNDVTCDIQGFFFVLGMVCSLLYSLSLTVYFLLVVKFNMSEAKIKKKFEPFLHAVPIIYSLTVSTSIYATNNYNSSGFFCWIAPQPLNCENDPKVECQSSGNSDVFIQAYGNVFTQSSPSPRQQTDEEEQQTEESKSKRSCCSFCPIKQCPINKNCSTSQSTSVLANYLSRPSRAAIRNSEEICNRAAAYVIGFMLTNVFSFVNRYVEMYGSGPVPFIIIFLARFFFPLQGLFNVIVYTYPYVISYRRIHTDCNWFQAFWKVIKSGGDSDQSRSGRATRRRSSLRQMQKVLEQSEYRQRSRGGGKMASISTNERREKKQHRECKIEFEYNTTY